MTARSLVTALQTARALEGLTATAEQELLLVLPQLDPLAPLVRPELHEIGLETWADMFDWVTRRGVTLKLLVADVDPVLQSSAHRAAWARASGFAGAVQGAAQVVCAPHGQKADGIWYWVLRTGLRARLRSAMSALRADDAARLTPVQRRLSTQGAALRPADMPQAFAIADAARCVLGGADLGQRRDATPDVAVAIKDSDFCGALRGHFADTWSAAIPVGASLATPVSRVDCPRRPQSRKDLRLLTTVATPQKGFAPAATVTDLQTGLTRALRAARQLVVIQTGAFRHDGLVETLVNAAQDGPDLQVILMLPAEPPLHPWDAPRAQGLHETALATMRAALGDRFACVHVAAPAPQGTLCLIDDTLTVVGSAALTRQACRWNTEAAALIHDTEMTTDWLTQLGALHLGPATSPDRLRRAKTWAATWAATTAPFQTTDAPTHIPSGTPARLLPKDLF
jgi:hypothetical protein